MNRGRCRIRAEDVAPGFWKWSDEQEATVGGVELNSAVPTRFFQNLDAYPREWGRLSWRVQLNALDGDRATVPSFRTFYPGIEWNLAKPGGRWFLSAWFRWDGAGPPDAMRSHEQTIKIDGETVLFEFANLPERPLYLRCRVDARDRRAVADEVRAQNLRPEPPEDGVISLDDLLSH